MRVNQTNSPAVQGSDAAATSKAGKAAAAKEVKKNARTEGTDGAAAAGNTSSARAEISAKSREFAQAKAIADKTPDVREEKIAELKRRIAAGQYKVDADAVADRMVDDHIRMSGIG